MGKGEVLAFLKFKGEQEESNRSRKHLNELFARMACGLGITLVRPRFLQCSGRDRLFTMTLPPRGF